MIVMTTNIEELEYELNEERAKACQKRQEVAKILKATEKEGK